MQLFVWFCNFDTPGQIVLFFLGLICIELSLFAVDFVLFGLFQTRLLWWNFENLAHQLNVKKTWEFFCRQLQFLRSALWLSANIITKWGMFDDIWSLSVISKSHRREETEWELCAHLRTLLVTNEIVLYFPQTEKGWEKMWYNNLLHLYITVLLQMMLWCRCFLIFPVSGFRRCFRCQITLIH